jgi:hypothetical protein
MMVMMMIIMISSVTFKSETDRDGSLPCSQESAIGPFIEPNMLRQSLNVFDDGVSP